MDKQFFKQFYGQFPSDEACAAYMEKLRWPAAPVCPHCAGAKIYRYNDGKLFKCGDCKRQFSVKNGTIFADSHIPLQDWFLALHILAAGPVSSIELAKQLQITQKSAWLMIDRIRTALHQRTDTNGREKPLRLTGGFDTVLARLVPRSK